MGTFSQALSCARRVSSLSAPAFPSCCRAQGRGFPSSSPRRPCPAPCPGPIWGLFRRRFLARGGFLRFRRRLFLRAVVHKVEVSLLLRLGALVLRLALVRSGDFFAGAFLRAAGFFAFGAGFSFVLSCTR